VRRDLNGDSAVGLSVSDAISLGLAKANVMGQDYYLVGSTLATGTPSKPLGFDAMLLNSDGSAWRPADDATLTDFTTYTTSSPPPAGYSAAKYSVDVTPDLGTPTTQYFDAARQAIT